MPTTCSSGLALAEDGLGVPAAGGAVGVEADEVGERGRRRPASAMGVQLREGEGPRLDAGEVQRDVAEPGGTDGVDDGLPQRLAARLATSSTGTSTRAISP